MHEELKERKSKIVKQNKHKILISKDFNLLPPFPPPKPLPPPKKKGVSIKISI